MICIHYMCIYISYHLFFFFNDTATTEIYPLSLHDALPISGSFATSPSMEKMPSVKTSFSRASRAALSFSSRSAMSERSEEHTSELQSLAYLVCRLLLEKKKTIIDQSRTH